MKINKKRVFLVIIFSVLTFCFSVPLFAQGTFYRNDSYDFTGLHYLKAGGANPDNFNIFIESNSDFRRFKLHIIRSRLTLGPRAICNRYRVDMNNDGTWEQGWTNSNEITITFFYPNPPDGISASHTVKIEIEYADYDGQTYPPKTKYHSITTFSTPRVYANAEGDAFVQLRDEDATNKIPVLMVEGFDPLSEKFPEDYYNLTWNLVNTDLIPNGYEVFILNFNDGGRDLRLNAEVVLKALEKVHEICPNYKIALAGLSMGGPIARYALAKKEGLGGTHDVGLFLSYDSPQSKLNSVHVSPDMQDWIYTLDPNIGTVANMQASLQSVAAKQMLAYNTYDRDHTLHNLFYDEMNALNGDGYPHHSYNVAVSNGYFQATYGYSDVGRHLMTLKINDNLINQVAAVQLDCGTGSKITNITMRRYGDVLPNPFFRNYYELAIIFNPAYTPTYSALDLVNPQIDNLTGDIILPVSSRFDDYVVQPTPLQHHELSTTTRNKIVEWLNRNFNITVNFNLLEGGSVTPDVYSVRILHGTSITVPPKTVNVNGQQLTYYFSHWEDGNTNNPRTFYSSPGEIHTATMKSHLTSNSLAATAGNSQRKLESFGGKEHAVYASSGSIWYTRNDGSGWSPERPIVLSSTAKNPSIAVTYSAPFASVHVVWEEIQNYGGYEYHNVFYRKSTNSGDTWGNPVQLGGPGWGAPTAVGQDATPVVGGTPVVVVWKGGSSSVGGVVIQVEPVFGSSTYFIVPGSNGTSVSPTLRPMNQGPFRLAFRHGTGQIQYREFTLSGSYPNYTVVFDQNKSIDLTAGYAWMSDAANPSIVFDGTRTFVAWDAACQVHAEEQDSPQGLSGVSAQRHVLVREYNGNWQPVVEFQHYNYPVAKPSVGINMNTSKIVLLWELNGNTIDKASRDIAGGSWGPVAILDGGTSPSLNHYVYGGNPTYAMYTGSTSAPYSIVMNTSVSSKPSTTASNVTVNRELIGNGESDSPPGSLAISRRGTLDLGKFRWGGSSGAAIEGNLWVDMLTPILKRGTTRERWQFLPDSVPGLSWMETQPLSIPLDADSLRAEVHVALTGFRVAGGRIPSNLVVFSADLIQTAPTQNLKRLTLGELVALGVEDTSLAFKIAIPLHPHRGKALRLRTRLIGQDESSEPAWSVLLAMDSVDLGSSSGRSRLAKNEMGGSQLKPTEYTLHPTYPNPFNPTTTIKFDLPEPSHVSLIIYDVLGRKVAELVNGMKEAGYHSTTWNASDVASGVYFARFSATDADGTVKLNKVTKLLLTK